VQTNIVNCHIDRFADSAEAFVAGLRDHRVLANFAGTKVRFVTHRQIDEAAVKACVAAAGRLLDEMRQVA
jgi:threonine aldolase